MQVSKDPFTGQEIVWLNIDQYAVVRRSTFIRTVLGSCVSIVLHDERAGLLAMNHFINPRSGRRVTEAMIDEMLLSGASVLTAHILGGANGNRSQYDVGVENVATARDILSEKGIAHDCRSVGGRQGRNVSVMLTDEGLVVNLTLLRDPEVAPGEATRDPWTSLEEQTRRAYDLMARLTGKKTP